MRVLVAMDEWVKLPSVGEVEKWLENIEGTCKLCKHYEVNVCCHRPNRFGECLDIDCSKLAQELHKWLQEK